MKRTQQLSLVVLIIFQVVIGVLQFINQEKVNEQQPGILKYILAFLLAWNLYIAFFGTVTITSLTLLKNFFEPRQLKKEMRKKIMDTMMDEVFNNERGQIRITIFKDVNFTKHMWLFVKQLIGNTIKRRRTNWGGYVSVRERLGSEFTKSNTYFYFSPDTREKCQGVAGTVRQSYEEVIVPDLPDIRSINLDTIDIKGKKADDKLVREYMRRGLIKDLDTLKRLNSRARHVYDSVLQNSDGKPRGVLVIDSIQDVNPFVEEVPKKLSHYLQLFSPTM